MEGGFCLVVAVRDGVVHQCSYVITKKKVQFVLTSCEFGSESKYSSVSLEISFLNLHLSADLYLKEPATCNASYYHISQQLLLLVY